MSVGESQQSTLLDLFAGCGGMTAGYVASGSFRPVLAIEMDRDAAETYRQNFGEHVIAAEIQSVKSFPSVDVVIGGPPCQGFSPLNRARVGLARRSLWKQYLRALEDAEPSLFCMENVPELLKSAEFADFRKEAEDLGYNIRAEILNAADFGVAQTRKRAIVIGSLSADVPWPEPTNARPGLESDLPVWRTFKDAVEGLPLAPDEKAWHRSRNPRPESVRRYKAVPRDGGNRFDMQRNLDRAGLEDLVPTCWRNKPTGTTDVFGRLWWDRPSCTIRTEFYKPEKGRYLHPSAHRPITIREAARCMGFADNFILPEDQSMTSIARQVGNAVPPPLAEAIAASMAKHLAELRSSESRPKINSQELIAA